MYLIFISSFVVVIALSTISAFLGPFIMWKGLSYFGDTLSHSAMLGITLGSAFKFIPDFASVILIALLTSVALFYTQNLKETVLSVINSGSIALAIFLMSVFPGTFTLQINRVLFGDILIVRNTEIFFLLTVALFVSFAFFSNLNQWVLLAINEDLAASKGVNIKKSKASIIFILSVFMTFAINIVGALLATAFLILPSATARIFSKEPAKMILYCFLFASLDGLIGILLSIKMDSPTGVSIVVVMLTVLCTCLLCNKFGKKISKWTPEHKLR